MHNRLCRRQCIGAVTMHADRVARHMHSLARHDDSLLRGKLGRLEERLAVLERIATDAPARLTAEIEKLRD